MLKIEIFKEDVAVKTREIPGRDGKPSRNIYEQIAYAHLGGKFPVQMNINLEQGQPPYVEGEYVLHSSSYIVNSFGGLELKKYGKVIVPANTEF